MAGVYQTTAGGDIGTLLRLIQEEKTASPAITPAATEPGSPIRELVQEPVLSAEAPESSRQVSLKPEGSGPNEMPGFQPVGGAYGGVVPVGLTPGIVGPVVPGRSAAPAPVVNTGGGGGGGQPSGGGSAPVSSMPSIGTSLRPTITSAKPAVSYGAPAVKGTSTYKTPTRSTVGPAIVKPPVTPTPTPIRGKLPTKSSIGNAWRA